MLYGSLRLASYHYKLVYKLALVKIEPLKQLNDRHVAMSEVIPLIIAFTVDKYGRTVT
jgi:hypothetical protein